MKFITKLLLPLGWAAPSWTQPAGFSEPGHRQWPCCLLLPNSTEKTRPIKVDSGEAKTTSLKMPITLEESDWQDSEITLLWSVTEIRDGCGMLEHLPRPHLLPGPLSKSDPRVLVGLWPQWEIWAGPSIISGSSGSTKRRAGALPGLAALILSQLERGPWHIFTGSSLSAETQLGRAYWQMHRVISLPRSNTPALTTLSVQVGSEIRISGCRWEAADVPQALLSWGEGLWPYASYTCSG